MTATHVLDALAQQLLAQGEDLLRSAEQAVEVHPLDARRDGGVVGDALDPVGVPDERTGEAIKIYVSLTDPALDEAAIIGHCREHLTGYKIPKHVEIRDDLRKSTVGKLLRRVLRDEARGEAKA